MYRFFLLYPGQFRRSNSVSAVSSTAFRTIAVAAIIQSGSLSLVLRRSEIVSFLMALVSSITRILSDRRERRFSFSSDDSAGLANNSISLITLINRSASLSSARRNYIASGSKKITALVSSTKGLSVIPFVPELPLVSHPIAIGIRGKDTKIMRNWLAVGIGGFFRCHLQGFLNSTDAASRQLGCPFGTISLFGRCKGKNSPPQRYFSRHVNGNPAAGRYVYGLCNAHRINIA